MLVTHKKNFNSYFIKKSCFQTKINKNIEKNKRNKLKYCHFVFILIDYIYIHLIRYPCFFSQMIRNYNTWYHYTRDIYVTIQNYSKINFFLQ